MAQLKLALEPDINQDYPGGVETMALRRTEGDKVRKKAAVRRSKLSRAVEI